MLLNFGTPQYTAVSASGLLSTAALRSAMLVAAMLSSVPLSRDSALVAGTTLIAAVVAGVTYYLLKRQRPSHGELEQKRRANLALNGRIIDGNLLDVVPSEREPLTLRYGYSVAGVSYECVQDVSTIPIEPAALRLELPLLVRYDRGNPADSIVVAEEWSGLRKSGNPLYRRDASATVCLETSPSLSRET